MKTNMVDGNISAPAGEIMKFILGGRTYDTASSTVAAYDRGEDFIEVLSEEVRFDNTLYRTAKGNFFIHYHSTTKRGKGRPVVEDSARAVDADQALEWAVERQAIIVDAAGLPMPDEA